MQTAETSGDPQSQVHYTILLAEHLTNSGRVAETPPLYERALDRATMVTEEPAVRMWALTHFGDALLKLGEPGRASLRYCEAYVIAALIRDVARQAWVLTHWALAQRDLRRPEIAIVMLTRALETGRARSDPGNVAWILTHLAGALHDTGRFDDVDANLVQALAIMTDNDDLVGQEFVLDHKARLLLHRKRPDAAVGAYQQASRVAELRGDIPAAQHWADLAHSAAAGHRMS